jgi:hypothetical protein
MVRSEFVRRLVLNSICDDFENVDQTILRNVAETGASCGWKIERSEVVNALTTLVGDGLAQAYILSGSVRNPFSGELNGMPPMDLVEEDFKTYFYITKKGMELHLSGDPSWPLFDQDQPG